MGLQGACWLERRLGLDPYVCLRCGAEARMQCACLICSPCRKEGLGLTPYVCVRCGAGAWITLTRGFPAREMELTLGGLDWLSRGLWDGPAEDELAVRRTSCCCPQLKSTSAKKIRNGAWWENYSNMPHTYTHCPSTGKCDHLWPFYDEICHYLYQYHIF